MSGLLASAKRVREDLAAWFHNHSRSDPKVPHTAAAASVPDHDAHHHALLHVPHGRDVSLLPFSLVANNQELVYASLLSDLSNLAYNVNTITDTLLQDRHSLRLVSTSEGCILLPPHAPPAPTFPPTTTSASQDTSHATPSHTHPTPPLAATPAAEPSPDPPLPPGATPPYPVPSFNTMAPLEGSSSSSSHVSRLSSSDSEFLSINPHQAVGAALLMAAAFTRTVEHLGPNSKRPPQELLLDAQASPATACAPPPPCAWFVADDDVTKVRHFVIQGSTNMEHWAINLHFQPVLFEADRSGARIHNGVYDAAVKLFTQFVPLVEEHLASSQHATVTFTGHSLGGSLATVVMLLMVSRGILPPSAAAPVFTYGAPAVFCQQLESHPTPPTPPPSPPPPTPTPTRSRPPLHSPPPPDASPVRPKDATAAAEPAAPVGRSWAPRGLLAHLGLSEDHVVNVIMHRDIVPRAFVCDYTQMASVLRAWWPTFKTHASLNDPSLPHKSIYQFLGRVAVLLPDPSQPFVANGDHRHPMLPDVPALYKLIDGPCISLGSSTDHDYDSHYDDAAGGEGYVHGWELLLTAAAAAAAAEAAAAAAAPAVATKPVPVINGGSHGSSNHAGGTMHDTLSAFMNSPHPLKTLADYASYGPNGVISRFHNPDHYTQALTGLLALQYPAPPKIAHITEAWR
ncbi:MAG: hypothetical protein WDW36_005061 [Sanguina aurantia]